MRLTKEVVLGWQLFQTLIAVKRILEIEADYYTYKKEVSMAAAHS